MAKPPVFLVLKTRFLCARHGQPIATRPPRTGSWRRLRAVAIPLMLASLCSCCAGCDDEEPQDVLEVSQVIPLPAGFGSIDAVAWDGEVLWGTGYTSDYRGHRLLAVERDGTLRLNQVMDLTEYVFPSALTVAFGGGWVSGLKELGRVDLPTAKVYDVHRFTRGLDTLLQALTHDETHLLAIEVNRSNTETYGHSWLLVIDPTDVSLAGVRWEIDRPVYGLSRGSRGNLFASYGDEGRIECLDADTGASLHEWKVPRDISTLEVSWDGTTLWVAGGPPRAIYGFTHPGLEGC
ncbi:MAG: hypothetical protein HYV63_23065 [Candidatus Schekmanbacteria bacterium]|nr:hypothetical protein [Candidatus Schekmanbacteria bacterium]